MTTCILQGDALERLAADAPLLGMAQAEPTAGPTAAQGGEEEPGAV